MLSCSEIAQRHLPLPLNMHNSAAAVGGAGWGRIAVRNRRALQPAVCLLTYQQSRGQLSVVKKNEQSMYYRRGRGWQEVERGNMRQGSCAVDKKQRQQWRQLIHVQPRNRGVKPSRVTCGVDQRNDT